MQPSDWINLGTVVLLLAGIGTSLFIGLRSLGQTKGIQEKQLKNTLLKDIVDWAESVIDCGGEITLEYLTTPKMGQDALHQLAYRVLGKYFLIRKRIPYIEKIAPQVNISPTVLSNVTNGIVGLMNAMQEQQKAHNVDMAKLYKEQMEPLNNSCADLITETADILGKDIEIK